jgi:hypothetical protein
MECLEMTPDRFDLMEAFLIMEGLNALNPSEVQILLEKCSSVKVKRLFLHFAEKAEHAWFKYLDVNKINIGSGKRSLVQHGSWVKKYQITLPESLA